MKSALRSTVMLAASATVMITMAGSLSTASAQSIPSRQAVVDEAMQYLHYPYSLQGDTPQTGFSCIGFVSYVFRRLGIEMPDGLTGAMATYQTIPESDLAPGDIVFFKNTWWKTWTDGVSHVAIYIGGGRVIHAFNPTAGVVITSLRNDPAIGNYLQRHYLVAERPLLGDPVSSATQSGSARGVIDVPSLNLRQNHSLSSVVITVLPQGTAVSVLRQWNNWLNVRLSAGFSGWVAKGGVQLAGAVPPSQQKPSGSHDSGKRYNILSGVNIHDRPALAASVISVTTPGMTVAILGHRDGFFHIQTPDGITGWTLTRFVQAPSSQASSSGGDAGRSRGHHSRGSLSGGQLTITAHLRTGPSLDAGIIGWVQAGTRVKILGRVPLWDHVKLNAKLSGYIYSQFVQG